MTLRRTAAAVWGLALLLALLGLGVVRALPARAGTDDYPADLKAAAKDSTVDPWRFYNRECTSFVAWRLNQHGYAFQNFTGGQQYGDAKHWGTAAQALGIRVDGTPAVGAVAWTQAGDGHVAWVEAVNPDGTITVEEYNATTAGAYDERTEPATDYQYLHIHDSAPTYPEGTFLHDTDDGSFWRVAGGSPIAVTDWTPFGGPQPTTDTTSASLALMPTTPADGTVVTGLPSQVTSTVRGGRLAPGGAASTAVAVADTALLRFPAVLITVATPVHVVLGRVAALGVTGTGFLPGTALGVTGAGLRLTPVAVVDGTHLVTTVSAARTTRLGARDLVVSGPDGARTVCRGCLVVDPVPVAATNQVVTLSVFTGVLPRRALLRLTGPGVSIVQRTSLGHGHLRLSVQIRKGTVQALRNLRVLVDGAAVRTLVHVARL